MHAFATWKGGHEALLEDDRAHSVTVDLPVDEGGRSQGPSALELSLLALAGSIATVFASVAEGKRVPFHGVSVALEAERPKGAPTITRVRGTLRVRTHASFSEVEAALRLTLHTSPVSVLFERAQIPIEVSPILLPTISGAAPLLPH